MKIKLNLVQFFGAMMFMFWWGTLGTLIFPIEYNIQVIGLGVMAIISFMIFLYGTFAETRKQE